MVPPHLLHMQHHSNTIITLFQRLLVFYHFSQKKKKKKKKRLLVDKIFLEVAQGKEATLGGTFKCHTNFHWKDVLLELDKE